MRTVPPSDRRGSIARPNGPLMRQFRERLNLTQEELAGRMNTYVERIKRMERGKPCQAKWITAAEIALGFPRGRLFLDRLPEEAGLVRTGEWDVASARPISDWRTLPSRLRVRLLELDSTSVPGRRARVKQYDACRLIEEDHLLLIESFRRHTQTCARLSHCPHIAKSYACELNHSERNCWVIDEWIAGDSLELLIRQNLPRQTQACIARDLLQALAALHEQQIVCRGLCPAAVIVRNVDHRAVVTDLELAKFLDSRPTVRPKAGLADDPYLAPEVRLNGRVIGPSADIYSWALIVGRMLCGADLVPREMTRERLQRNMEYEPLAALILQSLSNDWQSRPQNVAALLKPVLTWVESA